MMSDEYDKIRLSLDRTKKISKVIKILFGFAFFCFTGFLVALCAVIATSLMFPSILPESLAVNVSALLVLLAFGVVTWFLLKFVFDIFRDVAHGESPFTMRQVRRLRILAATFLASAIIEAVVSTGVIPVVQAGSMGISYVASSSVENLSINVGNLFCAAVFFAFSFVFKYGVLLQEFSDETL